ncbi:MAG: hypothetical protein ACR5LD_01670 [Symbiopectobacterium sp.]
MALFILLLTLLRDASFLWIMTVSLAYGVFIVFTEVAEPVVIKKLIQRHTSTSALSTYQVISSALCDI